MAKKPKMKLRRGMAVKLILYVFVSIMVIFVVSFHYTLRTTRRIVVDNLKSNAEYLTTAPYQRLRKYWLLFSVSPIILPLSLSKMVLMRQK